MKCPNCDHDLEELETFDNIYKSHDCPSCGSENLLEYEEHCSEDLEECWGIWTWTPIIRNNEE